MKSTLSFLWEIAKIAVIALVLVVGMRLFVFQPFLVRGASMEPNFEDSNYLIVNELGYKRTSFSLDGRKMFFCNPIRSRSGNCCLRS